MALSTRRRLLDSTALLVALLALLAAQQRHSCAEAAALPLSAVSPAELARLIEAGDQQVRDIHKNHLKHPPKKQKNSKIIVKSPTMMVIRRIGDFTQKKNRRKK